MSKRANQILWLISLIVVILIIAGGIWWIVNQEETEKNNNQISTEEINQEEDTENQVENNDEFKEEAPEEVKVPEEDEELSQEEKQEKVAVPDNVADASKNSENKNRKFQISGTDGEFSPSEVIAREGDVIHIDFTAQDKTYDIQLPSYGMSQTAKQGETKVLEFQANQTGKFLYYCKQCGGKNSEATGHIIVKSDT